jgi:beta-lactamase class A
MSDPDNSQNPKVPKSSEFLHHSKKDKSINENKKAPKTLPTQLQYPQTAFQASHKNNEFPDKQSSSTSNQYSQIDESRYDQMFQQSYFFLGKKYRFFLISSFFAIVIVGTALAGIRVLSPLEVEITESSESVSGQFPNSPNSTLSIPQSSSQTSAPSTFPPPPTNESGILDGVDLTPENISTFSSSDFFSSRPQDPNLQQIVDGILNLVAQKNLSTQHLSIILLDLNTEKYASYQSSQLHFPASIVKLFWMAIIFSKIEQEGVDQVTRSYQEQFSIDLGQDLDKLIKESDNEAGSRIVDFLTGTNSGESLPRKDLEEWIRKRDALNNFFREQGYDPINISQKTFPIPYLKYLDGPEGRDTQIRQNDMNPSVPIRNQITAEQATRLLYEIMKGNVGGENNPRMTYRLYRDLTTDWRKIDPNLGHFNPVQAFFGEGLAAINPNIQIYSKAGWTSQTRQEVAYINDGRKQYILTVFAEDKSFSEDEQIFPAIARYVHEQMPQ